MTIPRMARIRQQFPRQRLDHVEEGVIRQLESLPLQAKIQPGETVAITVGSRGIAGIPLITRGVVSHLRRLGAVPFIVPAMGSHGGATAEGQVGVLKSLGVTKDFVGAEIRSSMETEIVATTPQGLPVHFDRNAFHADHVLVMGRVKPHTMFVGDIESGLHKMMLIGLGKHAGALVYHRAIKNWPFETIIRDVTDIVLRKCRILAGVAIVENAYDETALIEAFLPADFSERERALLKQATAWLPRLPLNDIDLLIVDQIGKNISGTGMDTNIIGRKFNDHEATPRDSTRIKRIFVRNLSKETKGNASGIGVAEFTTERAVAQIDRESTRVNCVTSGHVTAGMIPLTYPDDRSAIEDALLTIGWTAPEQARIVHISDTLHLSEMRVSEPCLTCGEFTTEIEMLSDLEPVQFDEQGNLPAIFEHSGD